MLGIMRVGRDHVAIPFLARDFRFQVPFRFLQIFHQMSFVRCAPDILDNVAQIEIETLRDGNALDA